MKKYITIFLAITIIISLVACGSSSEDNSNADTQNISENTSENLYGTLKKELETTDELKANYFSKYYDLNNLNEIQENAENALNTSDEDSYKELYEELKSENGNLENFIDEESKNYFNVQTSETGDDEYPFSVDEEDLPEEWSLKPIITQNSKHPTWIIRLEPDTTDGEPYVNLFIDDGSAEYSYELKNEKTTEIEVETESGQYETALVNTVIQFTQYPNYSRDEATALNERPGYILKSQDGIYYMDLQSYDGEEFYVLYLF